MQWTGQQAGLLALLTLSYTVGEVAHFLIAVNYRQVASSIQFGDMKCFANITDTDCANLPDKQRSDYFSTHFIRCIVFYVSSCYPSM